MAKDAEVVAVKITPEGAGKFRFDVTVAHPDTGWEDYADRWEVLAPDGTVLAERVLLHPHVEEQPFTRSVRVTIPGDVGRITVRAHDSVHGLGGMQTEVVLER